MTISAPAVTIQRESQRSGESERTVAAQDMARKIESWGRYPRSAHRGVKAIQWGHELPRLDQIHGSVLAHGYGRSYGDSCLNDDGTLIDMTGLRRFVAFDPESGVMRCEAGVMLADIVDFALPRGWFLPVTPGTKFVTLGGAIANDVHGKNHHRDGTFGCHVPRFEVLRSNGERLLCSADHNSDLYRATIGGLGLTGLILWADIQLMSVPGPYIAKEQIKFESLDEFFDISADSDRRFQYTVSWVDCLAMGKNLGRGFMMAGNHDRLRAPDGSAPKAKSLVTVPIDAPGFALNALTVKVFNTVLYNMQITKVARTVVNWDKFFYPLDFVGQWNKLYGSAGFLQYQPVVPYDKSDNYKAIRAMLEIIAQSGQSSFLVVFKTFGDIRSPGMLSFPRPGVTFNLDFPYRGEKTLKLLDRLDAIVRDAGGSLYPAKDARMSARDFQAFYPQWREFSRYIDPKFSSNFWRRVTAQV